DWAFHDSNVIEGTLKLSKTAMTGDSLRLEVWPVGDETKEPDVAAPLVILPLGLSAYPEETVPFSLQVPQVSDRVELRVRSIEPQVALEGKVAISLQPTP